MSNVIIAAIIVLCVVVVMNICLTMAIVRRLRQIEGALSAPPAPLPQVGQQVRPFQASALDGAQVGAADLMVETVIVGFISAHCEACDTLANQLITGNVPAEPLLLFVVADGDDVAAGKLAQSLVGVARVCVLVDSEVKDAFGEVDAFPTLLRVESGVIRAAGHRLSDVNAVESTGSP